MISLLLPLLLLLMASIIVNSIPPISRQRPFFDCFRNKKRVPLQINHFWSISASALSPNSDTKEQVFDMPISANYGSTGRPPGKYLRHSSKEFFLNILEFSQPPFLIFPIEVDNNNNNFIYNNGDNNGGIQTTINYIRSTYDDNKEADTAHSIHRTDKNRLQRFDSISNNNNIKIANNNNKKLDTSSFSFSTNALSNTTTTTTTIDYNTSINDMDDEEKASNNRRRITLASNDNNNNSNNNNNNNNNNSNEYDSIDATSTTATSTTPTINYNTNAYDDNNKANTAHRIHRTDKIKWSNNNNNKSITTSIPGTTTSTTTSTINDDESFHISLVFKLICLYLIIIKSPPKEIKTAPEGKHQQQQQHYHGKHRYQFHLEQQQKHQYFKHEHHNVERMVASIALKLTLVAWDMWAFRNVF
jgi:hypothetical protein